MDEKWINLALGRGQWCALVTTIMSRCVPQSTGNLFTSCATISFSRQTLHQFRLLLDLHHRTFCASCNVLHRIRALLTAQNGCHLRKLTINGPPSQERATHTAGRSSGHKMLRFIAEFLREMGKPKRQSTSRCLLLSISSSRQWMPYCRDWHCWPL